MLWYLVLPIPPVRCLFLLSLPDGLLCVISKLQRIRHNESKKASSSSCVRMVTGMASKSVWLGLIFIGTYY